MVKFGLIGQGRISMYHLGAIESVEGKLMHTYDPLLSNFQKIEHFFDACERDYVDYIIVCSPSQFHREQIKESLKRGFRVITEKPMCLPWEPIIDDDRINVTLQLRYAEEILNFDNKNPMTCVSVKFYRNKEWFRTWQGNFKNTGGLFYHMFIHYMDLANKFGARFEGLIIRGDGSQYSLVNRCFGGEINLRAMDMQGCYNRMYLDILNGGGVKPKELFFLHHQMTQWSNYFGYDESIVGTRVYADTTGKLNWDMGQRMGVVL